MSDVNETLQDLLERRLRELGRRRGRGESISLREAWQRLPEDENGKRKPTYEVFRRIRQDGHRSLSDETAGALATMLDVPVDEIRRAADVLPRLGRFELPSRADALDDREREAILGVVDAILGAKGEIAGAAGRPNERRRRLSVAPDTVPDAVAAHEEEGPIAGEQEESDTP